MAALQSNVVVSSNVLKVYQLYCQLKQAASGVMTWDAE